MLETSEARYAADLGPVSQALEREVAAEVRRHGIAVWLDKDEHYTSFVDALAARSESGAFPYPVAAFRGSFVELLFALEPYGSGLERQPLLVHMPGFNEETIRGTPVLELYLSGVRYRKALDTLVREAGVGRVAPAEVEAFLARKPTLAEADAWLGSVITGDPDDLARFLEDVGQKLVVEALGGDTSVLAARLDAPRKLDVFSAFLHRLTGLDEGWIEPSAPDQAKTLADVLGALAEWLLLVEYVHDLRRPPHSPKLLPLRDLPSHIVKVCRQIVVEVRERFPEAYVGLATAVENEYAGELDRMTAEELGQIDTFSVEEVRVFEGAVAALLRGEWTKALEWHAAREGERSFWLRRDQKRRWAWSLVGEAAKFGTILAAEARPLEARAPEELVERYSSSAYRVDRAHRHFEQRRLALLESTLPKYGDLQEVVGALRRLHRAWADGLAREFARACKEHGFLPPDTLQQRTLFEQVVPPLLATGDKIAVFLVDALRFELAAEFADELRGTGSSTVVDLKARLAELPTITSVGMNALAPVARSGRLQVVGTFRGFKTGEFSVTKPEERARAMGLATVGKAGVLLTLASVGESSTKELKQKLAPHQLVVVTSTEIDDAGEANVGLATFDATLRQLKAAWHHLQLAGVKHFVFTADHGFLLQDETTVTTRKYGKAYDANRRHAIDDLPRQETGMVPVSMSSLGYDGIDGYLLLLEDTTNFGSGNAGAGFVHGGNSLQERVIPVLTVTRARAEGRSVTEYSIEAEPLTDVLGLHRLRVRVMFAKDTTAGLGFATTSRIALALRAEQDDVVTVVRDATGAGAFRDGRLVVPVGPAWTEVFFALEGPRDERLRVEVHHPDQSESVRKAVVETRFTVAARVVAQPAAPVPERVPLSWADAIEYEPFRRVFLHIEKHGAITEVELIAMLGNPRAARRFANEHEQLLGKLPFRVRTEAGEGGKRYVRDGTSG